MKPYERKQLLERVEREGATVGASIPEEIEIDEESVPLRAFVVEVQSTEELAPDQRERVDAVKRHLRRARRERVATLEDETRAAELSTSAGERLVAEIVGIDRALDGLADLGETDLEAEMRAAEVADRRRWRSFLDEALGEDGGGRGAGRGGGSRGAGGRTGGGAGGGRSGSR